VVNQTTPETIHTENIAINLYREYLRRSGESPENRGLLLEGFMEGYRAALNGFKP
jgi:hypothetical protein